MSDLLNLKIIQIIEETTEAKSFVFENVGGEKINYLPGQFLTFIFNTNGREIRRSYSISSTPEIDEHIKITVKKIENGEISRFFNNDVKVGDQISSLPPAGRFTLNVNNCFERDVFLIAGGSGISPLYSNLKNILANEHLSNVKLIYANKNESTTIFYKNLIELEKKYASQFKIINIYSSPLENSHLSPQRLNNFLFEKLIKENLKFERHDAQFLICGPSEMIRMAQITLHFMGFVNDQIKKENFIIKPAPQPFNLNAETRTIKIRIKEKTHLLSIPPNKFILQVALENHINLPYSCKGGRCSTCTTRLISGKVKMVINDVLTDQDLANGWILTCTAQPETDEVEIEIL